MFAAIPYRSHGISGLEGLVEFVRRWPISAYDPERTKALKQGKSACGSKADLHRLAANVSSCRLGSIYSCTAHVRL